MKRYTYAPLFLALLWAPALLAIIAGVVMFAEAVK